MNIECEICGIVIGRYVGSHPIPLSGFRCDSAVCFMAPDPAAPVEEQQP